MNIQLIKQSPDKWNVLSDKQVIGQCSSSNSSGGCYITTLTNHGTKITTFTLSTMNQIIMDYLINKEVKPNDTRNVL